MRQIVSNPKEVLGKWLCARTGGTYTGTAEYIALVDDDRILAVVAYEGYNGQSMSMHVAAAPNTKWATKVFLRFVFWYPFVQLGLKKVIAPIDSSNIKSIRLVEHIGFQREAVIKDAGKGGDILLYTLTKEQCKYIASN